MLRIAVIGSGASAISVIEAALSTNLDIKIDVFDPWNQLPSKENTIKGLNPVQLAKKSRFGSIAMYDYPSRYIELESQLHLPLSSTVGGLTTVWGANSLIPSHSEIGKYSTSFIDESIRWVESYTSIVDLASIRNSEGFFISNRFLNVLERSNMNSYVTISSSSLSIKPNLCTQIGGCLAGCGQHVIFSADEQIERLVNLDQVQLHKNYVEKINELQDGKFSLLLREDTTLVESEQIFDKVFVACGSIGSCSLLQRSAFIPNEIELYDTQVFYSAYFIGAPKEKHQNSFELAQLFIRKQQEFHISVYEFSNQFVERARLIIGNLVNLIPRFIWGHVIAGIGFVNSEDSGYLKIAYYNSRSIISEVKNSKSKKAVRRAIKTSQKNLLRGGVIPLPFTTQIPNVGASYHVGSAKMNGHHIFSPNGKISNKKNLEVYVMDSASLLELPVGPITTLVMAAAYARTKEALINEQS